MIERGKQTMNILKNIAGGIVFASVLYIFAFAIAVAG
jgi:hypothetical protein